MGLFFLDVNAMDGGLGGSVCRLGNVMKGGRCAV
jgi:hypothetical protein